MKDKIVTLRFVSIFALLLLVLAFSAGVKAQDVEIDCPASMSDSSDSIEDGLWQTRDGGKLKLGECTYYISRTIEARWDHHGEVVGAGKDKTFIKILPGSKISAVPISVEGGYPLSTMFLFENSQSGDIKFKNLSIMVTDPMPAVGNDPFFQGALWNLIAITGPELKITYFNVGFYGSSGNFFGYNVGHVSQIYDFQPVAGSISVTNCDFHQIGFGLNPINFNDADIDISANNFNDVFIGPIIEACSGCSVALARNEMNMVREIGIFIIHEPHYSYPVPLNRSDYLVARNELEVKTDYGNGIFLIGRGMSAAVSQNKINVESDVFGAGLYGLNTEGAVISNNQFNGSAFIALITEFSDDWTVKGNNVQKFETTFLPGKIGLINSHRFLVVGGSNKTNVLVDGGGDHVITGVNSSEYNGLGALVSGAMQLKKELHHRK